MKQLTYRHTQYACYLGYITQAIIVNLAPLLFVVFQNQFRIPLEKITLLITCNFCIQLVVDFIAARVVDKIGYRPCIIAAHLFSAAGLISMAVLPHMAPDPYWGLLTAVVLYAVGGGLIEVLVSPIVEACPTDNKASVMSLLHSFYAWGTAGVIAISTGFLAIFGKDKWEILACLWAILPIMNVFFFAKVPIARVVEADKSMSIRELVTSKTFWLFIVLMVASGASEQAMSQWASAFAERGLGISKAMGDLAGPCAFAIFMGTARALYGKFAEKIPLKAFMIGSTVLCIGCYLLAALSGNALLGLIGCAACGFSVGIFWPGTFSIAPGVLPGGGTAMYALMALAGDLGCSGGPTLVGMAANAAGGELRTGLLLAIVFPVLMLILTASLRERKTN